MSSARALAPTDVSMISRRIFALALLLMVCFDHCEAQVAVGVSDEVKDASDITSFGDSVWLSTTVGAFKVTNGKAARLTDGDLGVNKVAEVNGSIWLATTIGAYRLSGKNSERIPDLLLDIVTLRALPSGQVVLGTYGSAYLWDGREAKKFGPPDVIVSAIEYREPFVWLVTDKGAYRVALDGTYARLPDIAVSTHGITFDNDTVWVATAQGAYRIAGKVTSQFLENQDVRSVSNLNGQNWLAAEHGAYRIADGKALRAPDIEISVEQVASIDGSIWIASHQGAYQLDSNGDAHLVGRLEMEIKTIKKLGKNIWLGGYNGSYVVKDTQTIRTPDVDLEVQTLQSTPDSQWIGSSRGAYRIEDANIKIGLKNESVWGSLASSLLRTPVLVGGNILVEATYLSTSRSALLDADSKRAGFRALVAKKSQVPSRDIQYDEYLPIDRPAINLSMGVYTLALAVRDKWGNVGRETLRVTVLPGPGLAMALFAGFLLVFIFACIVLAPVSDFANDVLMNPWLRGIGSFGLAPIALSMIPAARRRLLQRYLKSVRSTFSELSKHYELPHPDLSPNKFLSRLSSSRGCLITGQSGIGKTSYLTFLTASFASPAESSSTAPVPIFIPLVRHRGKKVEDMIALQLAAFGSLRDRQLTDWYVAKGGFIFLLDGLNEVDSATQSDVNSFLEGAKSRNYFCVTSQVLSSALSWVPSFPLQLLSADSVKKILKVRLPPERFEELTSKVDGGFYGLFGLPQDLEFLIRYLLEHPKEAPPKSKRELYFREFETVFDAWARAGRADFRDLLVRRAYAMLQSKVPSIADSSLPWSVDFGAPLLERKLVVQRDAEYFFAHNLIRDYLASSYLHDKWRSTFNEESVEIDSNWSEVVKFILDSFLAPTEASELMFLLLPKNRRVAGDVFVWLESSRQDLVAGWGTKFKVDFADLELKSDFC